MLRSIVCIHPPKVHLWTHHKYDVGHTVVCTILKTGEILPVIEELSILNLFEIKDAIDTHDVQVAATPIFGGP